MCVMSFLSSVYCLLHSYAKYIYMLLIINKKCKQSVKSTNLSVRLKEEIDAKSTTSCHDSMSKKTNLDFGGQCEKT